MAFKHSWVNIRTTGKACIEAKLLERNCIGIDINYNAAIFTLHILYHLGKNIRENKEKAKRELEESGLTDIDINDVLNAEIKIYHGDSRKLDNIGNETIDLVATHPPYYNIIKYGKRSNRPQGDLSLHRKLEEYLKDLAKIIGETYRVLKPGKYIGVLVGDTRI